PARPAGPNSPRAVRAADRAGRPLDLAWQAARRERTDRGSLPNSGAGPHHGRADGEGQPRCHLLPGCPGPGAQRPGHLPSQERTPGGSAAGLPEGPRPPDPAASDRPGERGTPGPDGPDLLLPGGAAEREG